MTQAQNMLQLPIVCVCVCLHSNLSVTAEGGKSLPDYFLLKLIKCSKLHERGEKGSVRDEREGLSASVFEVANANGLNELMGGKMNSSATICRKMYILLLDRPFEPFRSHRARRLLKCHPSIYGIWRMFPARFEAPALLLCKISLVFCH